jgi:hypothetical protein
MRTELPDERQRLPQLFRQRQSDRIDAKRAIKRLDRAVDGVRAAHAEQQQLAVLRIDAAAFAVATGIAFERRECIGILPCHFAVDREKASGSCRLKSWSSLDAAAGQPEIRARCMTRPITTGGRAASTPAVAISP